MPLPWAWRRMASGKPKRTRDEMWSDLAADAWRRGREASDPTEALRWLERARRILPNDDTVGLSLALACLNNKDPRQRCRCLPPSRPGGIWWRRGWALRPLPCQTKDWPAAARALQAALSRHAIRPDTHGLASMVAQNAGLPGWCATDPAGRLHVSSPAELTLDGVRLTVRWASNRCRVPPGRSLAVSRNGGRAVGQSDRSSRHQRRRGLCGRRWGWRARGMGMVPAQPGAGPRDRRPLCRWNAAPDRRQGCVRGRVGPAADPPPALSGASFRHPPRPCLADGRPGAVGQPAGSRARTPERRRVGAEFYSHLG